jgi:hypothetical protein
MTQSDERTQERKESGENDEHVCRGFKVFRVKAVSEKDLVMYV